jgi:hypothetical protein
MRRGASPRHPRLREQAEAAGFVGPGQEMTQRGMERAARGGWIKEKPGPKRASAKEMKEEGRS